MTVPTSHDEAGRVVQHWASVNSFDCVASTPDRLEFRRGSALANFYSFTITKYPTTLSVFLAGEWPVIVNFTLVVKAAGVLTAGDRKAFADVADSLVSILDAAAREKHTRPVRSTEGDSSGATPAARLAQLKALLEEGLIDEQDFTARKMEILKEL